MPAKPSKALPVLEWEDIDWAWKCALISASSCACFSDSLTGDSSESIRSRGAGDVPVVPEAFDAARARMLAGVSRRRFGPSFTFG